MNPRELCKLDEALRSTLDSNPFASLKITENWRLLDTIKDRSACNVCHKSRKYFCYTCHIPVDDVTPFLPRLKLPIKIDIIKHNREIDGKSTAIHAVIIAPEDVSIYTYPNIPDYSVETGVVLIYPNKQATTLDEFINSSSSHSTRINGIKKAVFIDSTWNQSKGIYKDPRFRSLPCIVLRSRISQFWRHQHGSPRWYLATIEAVHQFLIDFQLASKHQSEILKSKITELVNQSPTGGTIPSENYFRPNCNNGRDCNPIEVNNTTLEYDNAYDNLLFFFRFMYDKIHKLYSHDSLRSYKRPLV